MNHSSRWWPKSDYRRERLLVRRTGVDATSTFLGQAGWASWGWTVQCFGGLRRPLHAASGGPNWDNVLKE